MLKYIFTLITLAFAASRVYGFDVLFHGGFEGFWFPPEGWITHYFVRSSPGHNSECCAEAKDATGPYNAKMYSPDIVLDSGEVHVLRFYSKYSSNVPLVSDAKFYLDDNSVIVFTIPEYDHSWTKVEIEVRIPGTAMSGYFSITGGPSEDPEVFSWSLDNFYVFSTATLVQPFSFGRIKTAFR
jgi:hypothetical protein